MEELYADYIRGIGEYAIKVVKEQFRPVGSAEPRITRKDIRWCVTVPAIWEHSARLATRNALKFAGLVDSSDDVMIALEPEAAAVFTCVEKRLSSM